MTVEVARLSSPGRSHNAGRRSFTGGLIGCGLAAAGYQGRAVAAGGQLSMPFRRHAGSVAQAPFGNKVSGQIENYNRVSPYVATAGLLHEGGLQQVMALGFKTLIDLRGANESGVRAEARLAERVGLSRIHLPVTSRAPDHDQVARFAEWVESPASYPMLVHCVSANRAGAIWALYRAATGVDARVALEEGRAAGLESREGAVRSILGLPAAE